MLMLTFIAIQVLIILAITLLEKRQNPGQTDWLRNLQAWALDVGTGFMILPLFHEWGNISLIDGGKLPFVLGCLVLIMTRDGLEFGFHLLQHKVPFMWRMHSLHHSDPEMSALTTGRHFWGDKVLKVLTIWPATALVVSTPYSMTMVYSLVSLYNFFIHANLKVNLGKWSWVINTPAYHRRHHSRLPEHYNSNYAPLLPIWDVICGTYHRPDGWPPTGQARAPRGFLDLIVWPFLKQTELRSVPEVARPTVAAEPAEPQVRASA